jgi:hypothetical protein
LAIDSLPCIEELVTTLREIARSDIASRFPAHADFIEELGSASDGAVISAKRLATLVESIAGEAPPLWYTAWTAAFDLDLSVNKLRLCLQLYANHSEAGDPILDGQLLEYHYEAWFLQAHAMLDKAAHLFECIYRDLVRSRSGTWSTQWAQRKAGLANWRRKVGVRRRGFAHEKGPVAATASDRRFWEVQALLGAPMSTFIEQHYAGSGNRRASRHAILRLASTQILAVLEGQLRQADAHLREAFKLASRP